MDRWAVTSSGVVKISRLTLRLRHSARRGPDPTAVLIKLFMKTYDTLSTGHGQCPVALRPCDACAHVMHPIDMCCLITTPVTSYRVYFFTGPIAKNQYMVKV